MAGSTKQQSRQSDRSTSERVWVTLVLGLVAVAVVLSPTASSVRNPPRVYPSWLYVGGMGFMIIAIALWRSGRPTVRWPVRLGYGLSILLAILAISVPVFSYFDSYHDLPWPVVVLLLGLLIIGGWHRRQRWLAISTGLFIVLWGIAALVPPSTQGLPTSETVDDLTVTIYALSRRGNVCFCDFVVATSLPGLRRDYDLDHIQIGGKVCAFLPFRAWSPHEWDLQPQEAQRAYMSAYTFAPPWTRSLDLAITVPRWPRQPAVSVTVPVPTATEGPIDRSFSAKGEGIVLTVRDLRRPPSTNHLPAVRCLGLTIRYSDYSYSGYGGLGLVRVTDQEGRPLGRDGHSFTGGPGGAVLEAEVSFIPDSATHITIDAYTPKQREANLLVFRFQRLPNPPQDAKIGTDMALPDQQGG